MKILWVRIVLTALGAEVLYGLFVVFGLGAAEEAFTIAGFASVFAFMAIGGFVVARKAAWNPILQGGLVGVAAVLLYTLLTLPGMIVGELVVTAPFFVNHLFKILGALSGAALAAFR